MADYKQRCDNCRFWTASPIMARGRPDEPGKCMRYPPTVVTVGHSEFPLMRPGGWCGEWQTIVDRAIKDEIAEWVKDARP